MAAEKKSKTSRTKSKRTAGNKTTLRKKTSSKRPAAKRETPKKKLAKKKSAQKKAAVKKKAVGVTTSSAKPEKSLKKQVRRISQRVNTVAFPRENLGARSGRQSGDLQGLSSLERADSESVDELLEEGNTFEAEVVTGVEDADASDEKEVQTHERPEDDVPDEYLDKE